MSLVSFEDWKGKQEMNGTSIRDVLSNAAAKELLAEIDAEILKDLKEAAARVPSPPPLPPRRFPPLYADKIVSVQPLLGPTGLIYYLRHRYGSNNSMSERITEPVPPQPKQESIWEGVW